MTKREQSFVNRWTQAFRDAQVDEPTARAVGYALATWANADGSSVRPGMARLMVAASLRSRTSVSKGIAWLLWQGWIEDVEADDRSSHHAPEYRLTLPPDVDTHVAAGAATVASYRQDKQERDAAWSLARRDRRRGVRP